MVLIIPSRALLEERPVWCERTLPWRQSAMVSGQNAANEPLTPRLERLGQGIHLLGREVSGAIGLSTIRRSIAPDVTG
jgi:hypothetical protein